MTTITGTNETEDATALIKRIWDPLERGESQDFAPFFDALAPDFVLTTSLGELHGRDALVAYFDKAVEFLELNPFVRPLEYFASGNRVVQIGQEDFTVKATGKTMRRDYVWVFDVKDGKITHILSIEDLSGLETPVRQAMEYAKTATPTQ